MKLEILKYLLILLFPSITYAQLQQTWVSVESRPASSDVGFISPIDGVILKFTDSLENRHVFSNKSMITGYSLESKQIFRNDSLFAEIYHLSDDSLVLDFDHRMRTLFYPIKPRPKVELSYQDIANNSWILKIEELEDNWRLTDLNWNVSKYDIGKVAILRGDKKWTIQSSETWSLINIDDQLLFTLYENFWDRMVVFQVLSVTSNSIQLKSTNNNIHAKLIRNNKPIPHEEHKNLKNLLVDKTWSYKEIYDYKEFDAGIHNDTSYVDQKQFFEKKISYQFNGDQSYCIRVETKEYHCGTWELLSDGNTLKLDKGWCNEEYILLEKINDEELVITNCNKFSVDAGSSNYREICYKVKLE